MRRRDLLFTCVTVLGMALFSETLCFTVLTTLLGAHPVRQVDTLERVRWNETVIDDFDQIQRKEEPVPHAIDHNVLHPYLGFVRDPTDAHASLSAPEESVEAYGFGVAHGTLVRDPDPHTVVIGLFGGSVAENFLVGQRKGVQTLIDTLSRAPAFRGKRLVVTPAALGGYKQPQELLAYTYLLSLGARFDLVITLDGFNDVALPPLENLPKDVASVYPRGWYFLSDTSDAAAQAFIANIKTLRWWQPALAHLSHRGPLRWSSTVGLLWYLTDRSLSGEIFRLRTALVDLKSHPTSYAVTGPRITYAQTGALTDALADTWERGSLQMDHLSRGNGTPYFHFLQPNQYVPGSKPMGAAEARTAVATDSLYGAQVRQGYPVLRKRGAELARKGVLFDDLTMLYANHPEPLYVDSCCHVSDEGSAIMANAMAAFILAHLPASAGR